MAGVLLAAKVGERPAGGSGDEDALRLGPNWEQIVNDIGRGRFYEAMRNADLFTIPAPSFTEAAAGVSPLAAGTGIPVVGVYNPVGSNKLVIPISLVIVSLSGTPGPPFLLNYARNATPPTAGLVTPVGNRLDAATCTALGVGGAATTGSSLGALLKALPTPPVGQALEFMFDGKYGVPQGGYLAVAAAAAGTTWVVQGSLVFAEVDLANLLT